MIDPHLAVVCDFQEENWPSMDLVSEMLVTNLRDNYASAVQVTKICPKMVSRLTGLPILGGKQFAKNADRLLNRFYYYRQHLRTRLDEFDLFHICDHSYSQLVHVLPGTRTGVFCHDLDTFRCLLEPETERRPRWFKAMAREILTGLQKAAVVFYTTNTVRSQIEKYGLLDPGLLVQAPYGVSPEFTLRQAGPDPAAYTPAGLQESPFLMHVGSCIPRKRIDLLLDVFAGVHSQHRNLKLLQVGGEWTDHQREQMKRLGVGAAVRQIPRQDRTSLASLYRRAALIVAPSEAEGFGLPLIEALACGSRVVASDIPVFREVGGEAVLYCPLDDIGTWVETINHILSTSHLPVEQARQIDQTERFTWAAHSRAIFEAYQRLL
jgi:glycosyltransferase involved in cell wall biosynthesis